MSHGQIDHSNSTSHVLAALHHQTKDESCKIILLCCAGQHVPILLQALRTHQTPISRYSYTLKNYKQSLFLRLTL